MEEKNLEETGNIQSSESRNTSPINCLRNERIIVRFLPKETGLVSNPKHLLFGGMAEGTTRTFVVPKLSSGAYTNILTDNEKSPICRIRCS